MRVLLVDDNEPLRTMLRHTIETAGAEVVAEAGDADTGLREAHAQQPDVVLLDINMPRMNGVEVLKDIKRIDESIAVIMVTANEQVAMAAEALRHGAFGYVPKPFDFRYLDHLLATILDRPSRRR
jgi:DNA-binding NtrC family response regulator